MFGLGWTEILIIAVVGLIIVGPKQLPEVIKGFGKFFRQINQMRDEWTRAIREDKSLQDIQRSVNEAKDSVSRPVNQHIRDLKQSVEEETEVYRPGEKPDEPK